MGGANPERAPSGFGNKVRADTPERLREAKVRPKPNPGQTPGDEADSGKAKQKQPDRRRQGNSRREATSRSLGLKHAPKEQIRPRHLLPSHWWFVSLPVLGAVVLAAVIAGTLPSGEIILASTIGAMAALLSKPVAKMEREGSRSAKIVKPLGWLAVLIPPAAFGYSLSVWQSDLGLGWPWVVAAIISFNTMCFSLLTERSAQQASCLVTTWGMIVWLLGSTAAIGAFLLAFAFIAAVSRYQAKVNHKRMISAQARERERNRAEDILNDYEETGQGWFWETDRRGNLSYISPQVIRVLGKRERDLIGKPFIDLFELGEDNREGERTLTFHLSSRSSFQELGVRANAPGEERWWSVSGRPAYDSFHNFVGFRGSGTDLTEKRRSEQNVNRLAQYDSLTGLANRFQMQQTLEKILLAPQEQQRECSVFLLDLDRFKNVNDTLGHPAGDALLKQVSQRLERAVGKDGRVGRLGGDEFKVVIAGRTPRDQLAQLAQEIIHSLSQPYSIEGQRVVIGASVGIAVAPDDGTTSEAIIRNSDLALYAAKDGGRGRYHFYSNDLHSAAEERNELEQDLRDAIANGDLELHYQPVVSAKNENIAGFEALLRWNHPKRGWLSPAKFIPIAEDTGLISAIGEWAIRTACADLATWPESVRCAVNVSALQFANPQLPSVITNAIARARIDPSRLELEITESVFLNDNDGTEAMFTALKRIGVRLALDDFGTGYASLGYLKKAPFDKIKIDQSFVRGATEPGSRNGAIITSITSLAESLGMDTTAEGVETLDELDLVRKLGCSHIQGYIYAKAMSSEAASMQLRNGPRLIAKGPKSARPPRQTMLRKVVLEHEGRMYNGTIRNMGSGGAMVEGLWNVPAGTIFKIAISKNLIVDAKSIWSEEDRMGVQFAKPIDLDALGLAARKSIVASAVPGSSDERKSA